MPTPRTREQLAKEAAHYRALARWEARRASAALFLAFAFYVGLVLSLRPRVVDTWWRWLVYVGFAVFMFGVLLNFIEDWIRYHKPSEPRGFSAQIDRRDGGPNYYFARADGTLMRIHGKRLKEVDTYKSVDKAEEIAHWKNLELAERGKYVGAQGEDYSVNWETSV